MPVRCLDSRTGSGWKPGQGRSSEVMNWNRSEGETRRTAVNANESKGWEPRAVNRFKHLVALWILFGAISSCSSNPGADSRPNVLFVLVDTLRADHLSTYGYGRETSPRIDALGQSGWVFENHISHAGQTVPATISMMLSKVPAEHGFLHKGPGHFSKHPPYFDSDLLLLPEVLHDANYRTGGFVANPFLMEKHNFNQGFDYFLHDQGRGAVLTRAALAWIDRSAKKSSQPFFAYLHLMDVHSPYEPPARYAKLFAADEDGSLVYHNGPAPDLSKPDLDFTVALYDAQIRYLDDLVDELLNGLQERGLLENTVVVLTADHGDEFLEHGGLGHGTSVYGELLRVPLILSFPPLLEPGRRVEHLTQHIDLAPTLLDLLGLAQPSSFRGSNLFEPADLIFAENGAWRATYAAGAKLIVNGDSERKELFDEADALDQRRLENRDLEAELQIHLDDYQRLSELFEESRARGESVDSSAWTEAELEQLRALGYTE